jgi:hypothetical protein
MDGNGMDFWSTLVALRRRWLAVAVVILLWAPTVFLAYSSIKPIYQSSGAIVLTAPKNAQTWIPARGVTQPNNPLLNFSDGLPVLLSVIVEKLTSPSILAQSALLTDGANSFSIKRGGDELLSDPRSPMLLVTAQSPVAADSQNIVQFMVDRAQRILSEQQSDLVVPTSSMVQATVVVPPSKPELLAAGKMRGAASALLLVSILALFASCTMERLATRRLTHTARVPVVIQPYNAHSRVAPWLLTSPAITKIGGPAIDGAVLAGIFAIFLTVIPARLVPQGLPVSLNLASLLALLIGMWWLCSHLVHRLGMAKGWSATRAALLLYAGTQLLTYGYVTASYLPDNELHATDRTIIAVASYIAIAVAVCDSVRSTDRLHRLLKVTVCGAAFLATVGIVQSALGVDPTQYLQIPGFGNSYAGEFSYVLERANFNRPAGTAAHPIEYGIVCAMILPLALYYAFRARRLARCFWWLCVGALGAGSVLSLSRSAIVCLGVVLPILMVSWPIRRKVLAAATIVILIVIMSLGIPEILAALSNLFLYASSDPSISGRTQDYAAAFAEITRHLWLGRGLGTKSNVLDNQYLSTLVENGLIGLTAYILVFLVPVVGLLRVRSGMQDQAERELAITLVAALSVSIVGSATYDFLAWPTATGLGFLLVGASGALVRTTRSRKLIEQLVPDTRSSRQGCSAHR